MKTSLPGISHHLFDDMVQYVSSGQQSVDTVTSSLALTITLDTTMLLLNLLPICFLCVSRRERCLPVDRLILALSLTDVVAVLLPSAIIAASALENKYTCYVYQVCANWCQLSSMCLITALCVDRWIVLRNVIINHSNATHDSTADSNCRVVFLLLVIYTVNLGMSCLPVLGLAPPVGQNCNAWLSTLPMIPQHHVFIFLYLVFAYINVLIVVMVSVSQVVNLCEYQRVSGKCAQRASSGEDRRNVMELSVMIMVTTLLFQLTWIPALVLLTLHHALLPVPAEALSYAFLSSTVTGLLNPVLYAVFSHAYRRGYAMLLSRVIHHLQKCGGERMSMMSQPISDVIPRFLPQSITEHNSNSVTALLSSHQQPAKDSPGQNVTDRKNSYSNHPSDFTNVVTTDHKDLQLSIVPEEESLSSVEGEVDNFAFEDDIESYLYVELESCDSKEDKSYHEQVIIYHTADDNVSLQDE